MKRSHGAYSKHSRNLRSKGRVAITKFLREFKIGDMVRIDTDPSKTSGAVNALRFNHRIAKVVGRQGKAYRLLFKDGDKDKILFVTIAHLMAVNTNETS